MRIGDTKGVKMVVKVLRNLWRTTFSKREKDRNKIVEVKQSR